MTVPLSIAITAPISPSLTLVIVCLFSYGIELFKVNKQVQIEVLLSFFMLLGIEFRA